MIETPDRFSSILDNSETFKKVIKELDKDSLIILDEVHNYKTPTSKRSKKLQKIPNIKKLGLTATAISNNMVLDGCSYLVMDGQYKNKTDFFRQSDLNRRIGFWNEVLVYNEDGEEILTYTGGVGWQAKETKAETKVNSALKTTYYEAYSAERKALKSKESDNIAAGADNTFDARA